MPEELDEIERRIKQLEIEEVALKKEKAADSKERYQKLQAELANLREQRGQLKAHWQLERESIQQIRQSKAEIERMRNEMEKAEREGRLELVAEIKYGKIPENEKKVVELTQKLQEIQKDHKMLREEVDQEQIAEVVARWTGIPVSRMLESEREKLLKIEERLAQRVIGQEEAATAVANAIRRSRAGLSDKNRPIGSFIFLGPTGVGKTELARALAEFLFDDENAMIRIDMSEYMERHAVSRLIGAPPGYVGYDEGGQLTEAVRRRPYSVVLLDEIEKAHPEVFNVLLQVLEDGRLTDNKGHVVNFKNTIIIMTSNIGAPLILEKSLNVTDENREQIYWEIHGEVLNLLRQHLRPEFLNRIDETIVFHSLLKSHIKQIVELQIQRLQRQLAEQKIQIELTERAKDYLANLGYEPAFGARPLRRVIQRKVIDELAKEILSGSVSPGQTVDVDVIGEEIQFKSHAVDAAEIEN